MRLQLTDPSNPSVQGAWTNEDSIDVKAILNGQPFTLEHDLTSSDDADVLYDLRSAPTFKDNILVQCHVDEKGTLHMVLSPSPDAKGLPLADLPGFKQAILKQLMSGSGDLFLPNKLPSAVDWTVAP